MTTTDTIPRHVKADSPAALLKSSATIVWLCLILATVISWAMGTEHGLIDSTKINSISILVIAFVKIRFIGLYFMELKDAPLILRALIEAWSLIVCAVTICFYLAG